MDTCWSYLNRNYKRLKHTGRGGPLVGEELFTHTSLCVSDLSQGAITHLPGPQQAPEVYPHSLRNLEKMETRRLWT